MKGIGEKGAAQLIRDWGSLEEAIAHADEIKAKRAREALQSGAEQARLSKQLATLESAVPLEGDFERYRRGEPDTAALRDLYTRLGFTRLLDALDAESPAPAASGPKAGAGDVEVGAGGRRGRPPRPGRRAGRAAGRRAGVRGRRRQRGGGAAAGPGGRHLGEAGLLDSAGGAARPTRRDPRHRAGPAAPRRRGVAGLRREAQPGPARRARRGPAATLVRRGARRAAPGSQRAPGPSRPGGPVAGPVRAQSGRAGRSRRQGATPGRASAGGGWRPGRASGPRLRWRCGRPWPSSWPRAGSRTSTKRWSCR